MLAAGSKIAFFGPSFLKLAGWSCLAGLKQISGVRAGHLNNSEERLRYAEDACLTCHDQFVHPIQLYCAE